MIRFHGFAEVCVHTGLQRPLNIFVKGIRGQGNDRDLFRIRPVQRTDRCRGLQAVHLGHADVHQDGGIAARGAG